MMEEDLRTFSPDGDEDAAVIQLLQHLRGEDEETSSCWRAAFSFGSAHVFVVRMELRQQRKKVCNSQISCAGLIMEQIFVLQAVSRILDFIWCVSLTYSLY